jgi:hypothetical protein
MKRRPIVTGQFKSVLFTKYGSGFADASSGYLPDSKPASQPAGDDQKNGGDALLLYRTILFPKTPGVDSGWFPFQI